MKLSLREIERDEHIVTLAVRLEPSSARRTLRYRTRTGALLRVDGTVAGAFDREHHEVVLEPSDRKQELTLEVERFALPTNRLPSGPGLRWKLMLRRAAEEPAKFVTLSLSKGNSALRQAQRDALVLWGHSHLDVAWLWAYSDTKRKAMRTFANAMAILENDPAFVFMQSQPQLYAFVEEQDPQFFERVRTAVTSGRFSAQPAALWVEPDCNCISGESFLRQVLFAHQYCTERFGIEPTIAWLPDTFGFPNTIPTLLAHCGIDYFGTTKLQWNDTNRFAHPQFCWVGPDDAAVTAALIDAYEGGATAARVQRARERHEPLIVGYGDGGGGPTLPQVRKAESLGTWQAPQAWFERIAGLKLPEHRDELYLEYHRGTYTTHHDVKAQNAQFERALRDVEERLAWCVAVRAPRDAVERLRSMVREAWTIVLRNQFHDVLPGTSVRAAYEEVDEDYGKALDAVAFVRKSADTMLPRARGAAAYERLVRPIVDDGEIVFDNGDVLARFNEKGALVELRTRDGRNVIAQGNLLSTYVDRPKKWEAWNVDAGYERKRKPAWPTEHRVEADSLVIRFNANGSPLEMRVSLAENEPFVRVECAVNWQCERTLLRMENWLTVEGSSVLYGSPHGTIERKLGNPAQFEVPGQRFARACDSSGRGLAIFSLDTYGWSARALKRGGMQLGHSLLRSSRWPDECADRGDMVLTWAFAPIDGANIDALERAWELFADEPRVRLFTVSSGSAIVTAVKPAEDGDGVVVRLRECNGSATAVRLRSGGRLRDVTCVDGLERPVEGNAAIEGEDIVTTVPAFGIRSYRVRF